MLSSDKCILPETGAFPFCSLIQVRIYLPFLFIKKLLKNITIKTNFKLQMKQHQRVNLTYAGESDSI